MLEALWQKNIQTETNPLQYFESIKNSIHIPDINMDEVRTIISAIKNSASGYDELPASILKQCLDSYLEPLTLLKNLSIPLGIVPDKLKIARVLPIFKGEDEQLVQNYRPISVLSFFSKKFEKIVATYLIAFLEDNSVFYNYQFGFRKSHAIITLVERVGVKWVNMS